jgi:hypothetical protein
VSKTTLGLDEKKVISISGGRFYYEGGVGKIRVKTIGSNSSEFDLSPGMGFQNAPGMDNFFGVEITNLEGVAQEIEYIISYREVFDNRVSFDQIAVDEFEPLKVRTVAGQAHYKNKWVGNSPGLFSCIALRNPVGSLKTCWVRKVVVGAPSVGRVHLNISNDMAAVELMAQVSGLNQGSDTQHGKKAYFGGAGSASSSVTDIFYSNGVDFSGIKAFTGYANAGSTVIEFLEPIRLVAGSGLWVTFFEVNIPMAVSFEIVEELI